MAHFYVHRAFRERKTQSPVFNIMAAKMTRAILRYFQGDVGSQGPRGPPGLPVSLIIMCYKFTLMASVFRLKV